LKRSEKSRLLVWGIESLTPKNEHAKKQFIQLGCFYYLRKIFIRYTPYVLNLFSLVRLADKLATREFTLDAFETACF
jgi:hypothetical protein